ncbi:MAG TPA: hypothetical protein VJ732_08260, partial [Bryobacteraceae bacterium]|nr:hypothetical protein [Bryobacteraceae bacterium]
IERGEQYKRAIYLFFHDQKRYPSKIEDLESFQNKHYLRHRYVDPMTGKDEWRLIHIGANGTLVDSINSKTNTQGQQQQEQWKGYVGGQTSLFQQPSGTGSQAANLAMRRRPSDNAGGTPGGSDLPPMDTGQPPATAPAPGMPGAPGTAGVPSGVAVAGMPGTPGAPQIPGQQPVPGQPPMPGQQLPGQQGFPFGQPAAGQPGAVPGLPGALPMQPGAQGQPGFPQQQQQQQPSGGGYVSGSSSLFGGGSGAVPQPGTPGNPTAAQQMAQQNQNQLNPQNNPALGAIQNAIFGPRPGGLNGIQNGQTISGPGGQVMGGGIAGIASKADEDSIMVYDDHTNYKEWEFIFDFTKWKAPPDPRTGMSGSTPASQLGNQPGSQIGTPMGPSPTSSPFGTQPQLPPNPRQ